MAHKQEQRNGEFLSRHIHWNSGTLGLYKTMVNYVLGPYAGLDST